MDIGLILREKFPDAEWQLSGDKYEGLIWWSDTPKPSKKDLEALWPEVEAIVVAKVEANAEAERKRYESYNSGLLKLKKLGLTDEEVAALLGGQ
jgi:hypothetical protein